METQSTNTNQEDSMTTPTLSIHRTCCNGKPAIELVVCNAPAELRTILDGLNILPVPDMANRRSIICKTPVELDAARDPLKSMFDAKGNWIA
jgi:hypothetical protein